MRIALVLLTVVTVFAIAGDFATGGADMWKFKGYGIFRIQNYGYEDADPDMAFSAMGNIAWEPTLNDFLSARAELEFNPTATQTTWITVDSAAVPITTSNDLKVNDVYLNLMPADGFCIRGGQFKRNIGWGYLESTTEMLFPDRPLYVDYSIFNKYGKRDIGLMLIGEFDMFTVDLAYTNGVVEGSEFDSNKQVTLHAAVEATDWLTIGAGLGMTTANETPGDPDSDTYSSNAIDVYGLVEYPMSETMDLHFTGEYLMLGYPAPDFDGPVLPAAIGAPFGFDGVLVTGITPMLRYEQVSPATMLPEGAEEPEDNYGAIDFCGNIHMGTHNVLQLGLRNYSYENEDIDGYTDIIANWRMNF